MFHVPEKYRIRNHPTMSSDESFGNCGAFEIPYGNGLFKKALFVIASDGEGWEHVSVHTCDFKTRKLQYIPTWEEMCFVKEHFWDDEDCVIQYHPAKKNYVNNHKCTLHLWRPVSIEIPIPNTDLIGIV